VGESGNFFGIDSCGEGEFEEGVEELAGDREFLFEKLSRVREAHASTGEEDSGRRTATLLGTVE
jgi:hypothetical protein